MDIARMKTLFSAVFAVLFIQTVFCVNPNEHNKVVCFWNSTAFNRQGLGKFRIEDVRSALSLCTHLIYGYAHINSDFEIVPGSPSLDTGSGYSYYRLATQLKRSFPDLKVYLSVGGNSDPDDEQHKYLVLTETSKGRTKFINTVNQLLNDYDFDGIDLAWQFPPVELNKQYGFFGSIWQGFRTLFGYGKFKDHKEQMHRDGFTVLVRDLKTQLRPRFKALTITVLPHVCAIYYDARLLASNIEAVHLLSFDQAILERKNTSSVRLHTSESLVPKDNVYVATMYWLERGTSSNKIVVGIPTYARTWKLAVKKRYYGSLATLETDGPGAPGPYANEPGLLSYAEVCSKLTEHAMGHLRFAKHIIYAYQPYYRTTGAGEIWICYQNLFTVGNRAAFVKSYDLGGVTIVDLSLDDFQGVCFGDKFPLVRAAKDKL